MEEGKLYSGILLIYLLTILWVDLFFPINLKYLLLIFILPMFPFNGSKTADLIIFVATCSILKLKLDLRKLP